MNKNIASPTTVPSNASVILPFPTDVAMNIVKRLSDLKNNFVHPHFV